MKFTALFAGLLLLGCSGSNSPTQPSQRSSQTLNAPYRQTVVASSGLQITFSELLEESRCPASVQCPWEGNAKIRLDLRRGSETASVTLNTQGSQGFSREAVALGYRLSLAELVPYPAVPGQPNPSEYVARILVTPV